MKNDSIFSHRWILFALCIVFIFIFVLEPNILSRLGIFAGLPILCGLLIFVLFLISLKTQPKKTSFYESKEKIPQPLNTSRSSEDENYNGYYDYDNRKNYTNREMKLEERSIEREARIAEQEKEEREVRENNERIDERQEKYERESNERDAAAQAEVDRFNEQQEERDQFYEDLAERDRLREEYYESKYGSDEEE